MGKRSASASSASSAGSDSDSGSSDARSKRHKKDHQATGGRRSRSKERKATSRSEKKDRKKEHKKRKEDKEKKRKASKSGKEKKSKKHSKSSKKRRRSRSRSRSSGSDSSSDASSRSRSRSSSPRAAAAASSSSVPLPSAASITRSLGLIQTLIAHGGGDPAAAKEEVRFLLFRLDAGSSVVVETITDPLVRHILATLFREMGLKVRQDPATQEQGWMSPMAPTGRKSKTPPKVAYKLLDLLADAFKTEEEKAAEKAAAAAATAAAAVIGPIGPSMPPAAAPPAVAPSVSAGPRIVGPALPQAEDFDRLLAAESGEGAAAAAAMDDEDDDGGGGYGPKLPSQMTEQERRAFDALRESREQLAALKAQAKAAGGKQPGGRDEWMTAMPVLGESGPPGAGALAAMMATGDVEAMKGRGFQMRTQAIKVEQDDDWTLSPAEKARKQQERLAIKQAEQAVYNVRAKRDIRSLFASLVDRVLVDTRVLSFACVSFFFFLLSPPFSPQSSRAVGPSSLVGGSFGGVVVSSNSSAAAAQAANDRMMARYKQQARQTAEGVAAASSRETAAVKAASAKNEPFKWDHAEQMGMRAVKGTPALKQQLASAFSLGDNFAPATNQ